MATNSPDLIHTDRAPWDAVAHRLRAIQMGIAEDEQRKVRRKAHRPDEMTLLAYTEGRLSWFKRWWIERHLFKCDSCRGLLADYVKPPTPEDERMAI